MRLALAIASLLALPAPAAAATAEVDLSYSWCRDFCGRIGASPDAVVTYLAAPGEANRLRITRDGRAITFSDPGAPVAAKPPCVSVDAHTASCDGQKPTAAGADWVKVKLADGDDSVELLPEVQLGAALSGGEGDDVLASGEGGVTFDGGPGADRMGAPPGWNTLSFRDRRAGVTVDLASGRTSDGDAIAGIKVVWGGHGPDRLLGGAGDDVLWGFGGADTLRGRGGEDSLFGGVGGDRLSGGGGADDLEGGSGADRLLARDGRRDLVACGGGRDNARIDAKDRVRACERVRRRGYTQSR